MKKSPLKFIKTQPRPIDLYALIADFVEGPIEGFSRELVTNLLYLLIYIDWSKKDILESSIETNTIRLLEDSLDFKQPTLESLIQYVELLPEGYTEIPHLLLMSSDDAYDRALDREEIPTGQNIGLIVNTIEESKTLLNTLPSKRSEEVVTVSSKHEMELALLKTYIEGSVIPIFKYVPYTSSVEGLTQESISLTTENEYPKYFRASLDHHIVEFISLQEGTIVDKGNYHEDVGYHLKTWVEHTDTEVWTEVPKPQTEEEWIPWDYTKEGAKEGPDLPRGTKVHVKTEQTPEGTSNCLEVSTWSWASTGNYITHYKIAKGE